MVIKTHRFRVLLVAFASLLVFAAIEIRLFNLQIRQFKHYNRLANGIHNKKFTINPMRGEILDRNLQILATSTFRDSIYLSPQNLKWVRRTESMPERIAKVLDIPEHEVRRLLASKSDTPLKRKVSQETADAMRMLQIDLDLPDRALYFVKESKRLYPLGDLAGPVLGFATYDDTGDNVGIAGLELTYNSVLQGARKRQRVPVNSWRQGLMPMDEKLIKETYGQSLVLTLDSQIQYFAQKALRKKIGQVQAKGGVAVVMEVATGAILAMASEPDFDPNDFSRAMKDQLRNRTIVDPIEIGSVMKILTAAILIDNQLLTPDEPIDCQGGVARIPGRSNLLKDSHPNGVIPYRLAFAVSSNIAAATVALRLDQQLYYDSLVKFGLGQKTGIRLPGEEKGVFRPVEQWQPVSRSSLTLGYETSLTALQVVGAVSAIANGGVRMRPRIVEAIASADGRILQEFRPVIVDRVASPETCKTMLELMEGVIYEPTGTGRKVRVPGYRVAGKSGTTIKNHAKSRKDRTYYASFVGVLPAKHPKIAIYVYVDEPDPAIAYYGGSVAGPVFAEIAGDAARILEIPSDLSGNMKSTRPVEVLTSGVDRQNRAWEIAGEASDITAKTAAIESRSSSLGWQTGLTGDDRSGRRSSPAQARPGVMPECFGLTMRDVFGQMTTAGINPKLFGTGLAIYQSPSPGTDMIEGEKAVVIFAKPSQRMSELGDSPEAALEFVRGAMGPMEP